MALKDTWVDKIDGIDDNSANDVNQIAHAVIDLENQGGGTGEAGKDGITPHIGANGNWYLGDEDTGIKAQGTDGKDGADGKDGKDGYTPVKGVDYFDGKDGTNGTDGTSATHSWNGTTLTITSASGTSSADLKGDTGETGATGANGQDGYTPVKGVDYFTEADKEEIIAAVPAVYYTSQNLTEEQKAQARANIEATTEADIVEELAKRGQLKPEFASSIDECIDTSKLYVLPDGYIYANQKVSGQLIPNFTNQFSKDRVHVNSRYAANKLTDYANQSGTVAEGQFTGHFAVHNIPIDFSDLSESHVIRIANFTNSIKVGSNSICPIMSGNPKTDYALSFTSSGEKFATIDASNLECQTVTLPITSYWHTVSALGTNITSFGLVLKLSSNTITLDDVPDDLIVTVDEPIEYIQGEDYYAWINTGHAFVPADYEDRILNLEDKTSEMQTDIDSMKSACLNANLLKSDIVRSVNHRGYNLVAPENTLPAYKLSKAKGFEYVECDISMTSDGKFVLLHNATIDDTSNGTGTITEMTLEQVRAYDFGSWKSEKYEGTVIPTLEEFLLLCRNIGLKAYLEIKNGTWTQEVINECVAIVKKYRMERNVTWIAFSGATLGYIADADNKARLGLLGSALSSSLIENAKLLKNNDNDVFVNVQNADNTVDDALITQCIDNEIGLEVWNVNTESGITALNPYVSGVTTNSLIAGNVLYNADMKE